MTASSPTVYDHYRATGAEYEDGTYRVVGVDEDAVTLLRVGDASGRRVNTGDLVTVSPNKIEGFESAENPDSNRRLTDVVSSVPETAYWSVLAFAKRLASSPIRASVGVALVLAGSLGEGFLPVSDTALGALITVGSLWLAYVGSGRM